MKFETREIAIIVVFSSLGAAISVPVGYMGNYLKMVSFLPFGSGQMLAGIHILPVALAMMLVRRRGAAVFTATVKGLVEAILFSFHGFPVILLSGVQGLVLDAVGAVLGYDSKTGLCLGCGLSSASNVAYLQFIIRPRFPLEVFAFMYVLAFFSGVVFGGYLGDVVHRVVQNRILL